MKFNWSNMTSTSLSQFLRLPFSISHSKAGEFSALCRSTSPRFSPTPLTRLPLRSKTWFGENCWVSERSHRISIVFYFLSHSSGYVGCAQISLSIDWSPRPDRTLWNPRNRYDFSLFLLSLKFFWLVAKKQRGFQTMEAEAYFRPGLVDKEVDVLHLSLCLCFPCWFHCLMLI